MANAVIVTALLPQAEAQALLEALREQYRLRLNEYWYGDQYRFVADGQRHGAILAHVPVMAAQKRLMAALSQSLKAVKHS
ncbi:MULTISPECIES: hypothetical protein [Pseudomonas syringae group]|uniref:Uncharacterized protein n=3 Tax=Pseudomonas syringae group TaxID=136849 RepID=F3G6N7_PSESJ|nr:MULTISPECIES: hypothetical protein [Pseudomonas syringae group]EGH42737.1 hypothetical protein PSYPI_10180 [Pseudomonas syringae pv. pisi str. 1704B]PYD24885.1 hypothetical protein DND67_27500 [Pseudomonas syringae pv. pisi]RML50631.1 hypothetical protein ALQ93_03073 [Pseudomonas syringae pv. pisi]RMM26306.1 hypothetical protein ALQ82_01727 [Pseudomonas syringae pv. pisi]RMO23677.1 hypothetical protein ALQ44_02046 [Pseudomonas syringae pv. pisi]